MKKFSTVTFLAGFLLAFVLGIGLIVIKALPLVSEPATQKTSSTSEKKINLLDEAILQAQKKENDFTYLVVASKYNENWKLFLHDFDTSFSFQYSGWGMMRIMKDDLSATDADVTPDEIKAFVGYRFCGEIYCDEATAQGYGFDLIGYNAQYDSRSQDPYFTADGGTYVGENAKYVYVYKPFSPALPCQKIISNDLAKTSCEKRQKELNDAVAKIFKSFKVL